MRIYPHEITRARKNLERYMMYQFFVTNAKDGGYLPGPCPIGFEKSNGSLMEKSFWVSYLHLLLFKQLQ